MGWLPGMPRVTAANHEEDRMYTTDNPAQTAAYEYVQRLLTYRCMVKAHAPTSGPGFWLAYGSTEVLIRVEAVHGDRVHVRSLPGL
jgi:hypothetical protein